MANWTPVLPKSELPAGAKICREVGDKPICLMNIDDQLFAVINHCPHAGLPLGEGDLYGKQLTCPFHGFTYNVETGKNADFDDDMPLARFPVRITGDQIEVDTEPIPK